MKTATIYSQLIRCPSQQCIEGESEGERGKCWRSESRGEIIRKVLFEDIPYALVRNTIRCIEISEDKNTGLKMFNKYKESLRQSIGFSGSNVLSTSVNDHGFSLAANHITRHLQTSLGCNRTFY